VAEGGVKRASFPQWDESFKLVVTWRECECWAESIWLLKEWAAVEYQANDVWAAI